MSRAAAGLGVCAAGLGFALLFALLFELVPLRGQDPRGAATASGPVPPDGAAGPPAPVSAAASDPPRGLPPLPASLAGTEVDGALVVDAQGRFVPTPDAIDLFDYYLAAQGEEPAATIRARIVAAIRARLQGDAARAAERLLDDYLAYRVRASELLTGPLVGEDLARRLQYIRELRRELFGAGVARALFAEEEARWFSDLERRRLLVDPDLAPDERAQRLAALDAELPEELAASRRQARSHRQLREDEQRLREEGAGPAQIARLREERFGAGAARRLAGLDAQRARWQARVDAYRTERDALLTDALPEDRDALLEALRARHFEAGEQVRIRALDRLEPPSTR